MIPNKIKNVTAPEVNRARDPRMTGAKTKQAITEIRAGFGIEAEG
jgi:hypothetical protein